VAAQRGHPPPEWPARPSYTQRPSLCSPQESVISLVLVFTALALYTRYITMKWLHALAFACCMTILLAAGEDSRWVWGNENRRSSRVGEFNDGRPVLALNGGGTYGLTPAGAPRPVVPPALGPQPFPANLPGRPGPGGGAPVHEFDDIDDVPFHRPALRPPGPPVGGYRPFPPGGGPYSDGGFQGGILPGGVRPGFGRPPPFGGPNGGGPIGGGAGFAGGPPNPAAVHGGGFPPPGIGGPGLGPNGAPVPPYENPHLKDPPPHTGGYDTCKCALSFNCNSPGIKFGSCDAGKQYCCYNSHLSGSNRRPSSLPLGPRPGGGGGGGPGVLVGPGGPFDGPPPHHGGPGQFTPYAANKKVAALNNKL
ncbi:hypothetical protein B566_EDAN013719, partial [Ephemera danica]